MSWLEPQMLAFMLVAGALVGLVSSYFGVGACFIMVPVMIYCFETFMGTSHSLAPLIAFGTNMAVVVPTALSGALRHRRELAGRGASFPREHFLSFAPFVGLGSFLGSLTTFVFYHYYPKQAGIVLKMIFGIFCLFGAYRFMMAKPLPISELRPPNKPKYALSGLAAGFLAHFIGIGGGILYMPVLNSFLLMPVHLAVATSLATMVIGSSVGALSFAFLGYLDQVKHPEAYPPLSFGWFNALAFACIGGMSIIMAQVGPRLAHRTPPGRYKVLLAVLYIYIGMRLLLRGAFQLQGLHPPIP